MPIDERSISLPEQWAKDAQTVIPAPPVPGIAYRNTAITPEQWAHGQDYSRVADSAQWNQMFWTMSGLLKYAEQYGVMPYSSFTDYPSSGLCLGEDGEIYQALQPSGPNNGGAQPTNNTAFWKRAIVPQIDATSEPTPNTIMLRDEAGRTRAEDPVHDKDVANKKYVDDRFVWVMTGSITLNGTTNNTVGMTGIVPELELEIGDVIRIDTGAYNKLHTVESITDNSSIIVNYEHAGNRGDGSLKLPDFTGQATVTRIAKWFNAPIGLGQEWVNVTSRRSLSAASTNSTNRTIEVSFYSIPGNSNNNCSARINSALVLSHSFGGGAGLNASRNGYMYLLHHHSEELIIDCEQPMSKWFERR